MGVYRVRVWHMVLTLCLLAAVVIAVFSLGGRKETDAVSDNTETVIDNETIEKILGNVFSSFGSIKNLHAEITEEGKIKLSADVNPREITDLASEGGANIPRLVRLLVNFMPEKTELSLEFSLAVNAENREFEAKLEKIMLAGNEISTDIIPESVNDSVSIAVNKYLREIGADIGIIEFRDGAIAIRPKI